MKKLYTIFLLITTMLIAQPGVTEIPYTMSFQGILKDANGDIYENGEYSVTFRLFSYLEQNEQMIWENVHTVNVTDGLFSVILIDLPATIRHTVEMEIQVGDEILSPRHSFTSVPFSFSSHFSLFAGIANEADTSVVSHHAQFSVQAERSDSSNFAQNSGHSIYSDTALVALSSPTAGTALHATYADTSLLANNAINAHYADTALVA